MHVVRGLCARVLQNMMADLRKEVHRRQQLLEAAEGDAAAEAAAAGRHGKGKAGRKAVASLPVASITASSMRGSNSSSSSSAWGDDLVGYKGSSSSSHDSSSKGAGGFLSLPDLLAAAVPLEITIRL
jgi:hypothetical protein